ncbi:SRPBCC family protein [Acuticoccus yangtzensis]|uniref:SRPBCC family protein n=1 Tax=Acuticoccus yangtzensis TaxID=1443441 RepID=UPI0009497A75|nr:carbon monoxide dehydrogenase subunit G [Acuticoccus yangtzensis]
MEFSGEKVIGASQERVYDALHDPVVLRQVLPGVQSLHKLDADKYEISATLKIGGLKPTLSGLVELYNQDRPSGYSLRGQASSANGTAIGSAHVALAAIDSETTNLAYHISMDLDGQLAAIEVLRLETTARTLTGEFFSRLQTLLDGEPLPPAEPEPEPEAPAPTPPPQHVASEMKTVTPTYASTDATGNYVVAEPDPDPRYDTSPVTRRGEAGETAPAGAAGATPPRPLAPSLETTGFDPRPVRAAEPQSGGGIGRWIGVIIGLVLIAALLNNNF